MTASDRVGGASARGASHIRAGQPNQDACGGGTIGTWTFIAVADGHGSRPHFRSDRGARFAVEAARAAIAALSAEGTRGTAECGLLRDAAADLPWHLVTRWREAVRADIAADPDVRIAPRDPFVAYGATCVAAAFAPGLCLLFQIGDGDLVVAAADGDLARPLPDDEGLIGEQTYSLCQPDAASYVRCALFCAPHPLADVSFAMASTDGLSKSFARTAQFMATADHWRAVVAAHGLAAATRHLDDWLARVSEAGSGDDVTLMLFHDSR